MSKITVIIVTYKKKFEDTPSSEILLKFAQAGKINLIIYNNDSNGNDFSEKNILNINSQINNGLSIPYNFALLNAQKNHSKWLLVLDHDTKISIEYLEFILSIDGDFKAILPIIESKNMVVSPLILDGYVSLRKSLNPILGKTNKDLMAINSGSVFLVKKMIEIGGFNKKFKLDFLDHWIFWRLNKEKDMDYLISPLRLKHDLSVQKISSMNEIRYRSIINAEAIYYKEYNKKQFKSFVNHLPYRAVKQFFLTKKRKLWKMTLKEYILLRKEKNIK